MSILMKNCWLFLAYKQFVFGRQVFSHCRLHYLPYVSNIRDPASLQSFIIDVNTYETCQRHWL